MADDGKGKTSPGGDDKGAVELGREAQQEQQQAGASTATETHSASLTESKDDGEDDAQHKAASIIQSNYRGYRNRRELSGCGMSASSRWVEVLKDAQYQNLTKARPKQSEGRSQGGAAGNWKRLAGIANRAGGDEDDVLPDEEEGARSSTNDGRRDYYRKKLRAKQGGDEDHSKTMGLPYWLEIVDNEHRYGSNLSAYHAVWRESETEDNFFHWLDVGEGKGIDTEKCSREKLDENKIQYLSKEERGAYLVVVDEEGLLRWNTSGELVTTHTLDEEAKAKGNDGIGEEGQNGVSDGTNEGQKVESEDLSTDNLHNARGVIQAEGLTVPGPLAELVEVHTDKSSWIFVVDTSFRIYVGIKESGTFQHSSFLHGSRILSAGLISIRDGQLLSLSPHSGHYRPTASNFWALVKCLEAEGVDMSQAAVWKGYATLLAAQTYTNAAMDVTSALESLNYQKDKILNPEAAKKRDEAQEDGSKSAALEREHVQQNGNLVQSVGAQIKGIARYPFDNKT